MPDTKRLDMTEDFMIDGLDRAFERELITESERDLIERATVSVFKLLKDEQKKS